MGNAEQAHKIFPQKLEWPEYTGVINFRQGCSEVFFTDCDQNKRDVNANRGMMWQSTTEHVDVTAEVSWAHMLVSNNR